MWSLEQTLPHAVDDINLAIANDLQHKSWAVVPDFLNEMTCAALVAEIDVLRDRGTLQSAGVGRGLDRRVRPDVRGDAIAWLEPTNLSEPSRVIWERLKSLQLVLNRQLFLGLRSIESHLTWYPSGSFYQKHFDNFRGSGGRLISFIVYLNKTWQPGDGGELVIYEGDNEASGEDRVLREVPPKAGVLACFHSMTIAHEVRPTKIGRYSVTGWFLAE